MCAGEDEQIHPIVCSGKSPDNSSKFHLGLWLGHSEQCRSLRVPGINSFTLPPLPKTPCMSSFSEMNEKEEGRESRRHQDCMLCGLAETTGLLVRGQYGLEGPGQRLPSGSGVKWVNSALEKQDWVNM